MEQMEKTVLTGRMVKMAKMEKVHISSLAILTGEAMVVLILLVIFPAKLKYANADIINLWERLTPCIGNYMK